MHSSIQVMPTILRSNSLSVFVRTVALQVAVSGLLLDPWSNLAAHERPRLTHRWEVEPNLGASWLVEPVRFVPALEPARFSSTRRQFRVSESQKAIRYADEPNLAGRQSGLQSILSQLESTDENRQSQLRLASAAIKLADASHADLLWQRLRDDDTSRRLIERALVTWKSSAALDVWRARLSAADAPNLELIVALEGIAAVGTEQDIAALQGLLRSDRTSAPLKVLVARTMGSLATRDLEDFAEQVTESTIDQHELIVAELLSRHTSQRARDQLVEILKSNNNSARNVAYVAVAANFGELARELAPEMILQPDNVLREQAVEVFNRFDDAASLRQQAIAIDDSNLAIRNIVRRNLEEKAQNADLRPIVDQVITAHLQGESPHSIVQAVLLSVSLEERERCPQLVTLLDHADMDTRMTAAWGLQALAESPEVLDRILKKTERLTERLKKPEVVPSPEIVMQAYLFEALGRNRYEPALESLKIYIPKNGHQMGDVARAAAIWAIGKIKEGSQDAALAKQIAERMLDLSEGDPEDPLVRFTATVALGWINAPASVVELNKIVDPTPEQIALARDWSLKQLSNAR